MLKINGVSVEAEAGKLVESLENKFNSNESDTGVRVVQKIRSNVLSLTISLTLLTSQEYDTYMAAIDFENTVELHGVEHTMVVTGITKSVQHSDDEDVADIWSLTIDLEEL